jgi:hypothetical protein
MNRCVNSLPWLALHCAALLGCGAAGEPATTTENPDQPESNQEVSLKKVNVEKLPPVGDYLRPEDGGHIEAAPPKGWIPKIKGKDYLYAFVKEKNAQIPLILVKSVSPIGGEDFNDVTEDNVKEFAQQVKKSAGVTVESPRPIVIGKQAFARYVKEFKANDTEVQILTTVRGGRGYNVELRVRPLELKKYRDSAYAVAGQLRFSADAKEFEFKPEVVPPDAPPAETPPAAAPPPDAPPPDAPPAAAPPAVPPATTPPGENK